MSRIAAAFDRARRAGRIARIPYLTTGDPSADTTVELALALQGCGADILELGVPFSDPLADGVINQRSAGRALRGGMNLAGVLEVASRIRGSGDLPLVLFTYFNPILRMGVEAFARRAAQAGVDGVLVTDLPVEESDAYRQALGAGRIDPIFLVAPTTREDRVCAIGEASGSFIYYVLRRGVTGERDALPEGTARRVRDIRKLTGKPVAVGFGVARREQVREIEAFADGVVTGSALMRVVEETPAGLSPRAPLEQKFRELVDLT